MKKAEMRIIDNNLGDGVIKLFGKDWFSGYIKFDSDDFIEEWKDQFYVIKEGEVIGLWFRLDQIDFKDTNIKNILERDKLIMEIIE